MGEKQDAVQQEFAKRLKTLRTATGLTQGQLAERLGVSRGSISFYENCDRVPDILFLNTVSEFFGIDPDYMLGYTQNLDPRNGDIGLRLNFSDQAINFFEENEEAGKLLSSILEGESDRESFLRFYDYCFAFVTGRPRYYSLISPLDAENFVAYKISEILIRILRNEKEKAFFLQCQNMSEADVQKAERRHEESQRTLMHLCEKLNEQLTSLERVESDQEREEREIRKKVRALINAECENMGEKDK